MGFFGILYCQTSRVIRQTSRRVVHDGSSDRCHQLRLVQLSKLPSVLHRWLLSICQWNAPLPARFISDHPLFHPPFITTPPSISLIIQDNPLRWLFDANGANTGRSKNRFFPPGISSVEDRT